MNKYLNTYRIESTRMPFWDYRNAALYFVTICTKNRIRYFGNVDSVETPCMDGVVETPCMASLQCPKIQLSEIGCIAENEWLETFELRRDMNLYKGEFIVMPDHFHAIIGIGDNPYNARRDAMQETGYRDAKHGVSTGHEKILNHFGPQSKNLASIIRGFKSAVTTAARKINAPFEWQPRYHEHIIRNDNAHRNIKQYILSNPMRFIP